MNEKKLALIREKLKDLNNEYEIKKSIFYVGGNSSPFSKKTEKIIMIVAGIFLIFGLFATVTGFGSINIFKDISNESVIPLICFIIFFISITIFSIIHTINLQVITKVIFNNNIITINTCSMQGKNLDYSFSLNDYIFTTQKVLSRRSENSEYFDEYYYLIFTEKDSKKSKEFEIFPNDFDEYYAFIIYIKLFAYNIKLTNLSDENLNILYKNCNNGKYGLITIPKPKKLLLILGLVFLVLFLLFSVNIILSISDQDFFFDSILVGLLLITLSILFLFIYFKQKKQYSDEMKRLLDKNI